jgi:KDO2-lipid IV(A) lauroyltransferase
MLTDQNVKANHAVFVDFFGIKAATTKTVALAALRTGAGVIFASPLATGLATHRIFYREINTQLGDELSVEEKVVKITQDLNHAIEACIREQPESWFWIHRRFKTRPPGEPETIYK